ncbi:MAG: XrtA/PEP-CTERM system exopolysaccharide export protein [Pseudomonadota bacterium]
MKNRRTNTAIRRWLRTGWIMSLLVIAVGCAAPTSGPVDAPADVPEFADEYRIGMGDNLQVNVWRNPDLSVTVPVRPDGKISVPLAGDVDVGGKTPEEVSALITESIATYIREPFVTVIVTDVGSNQYRSRVRVTGAVSTPLSVPYRQGMTVLDLVLEAGGITEFANAGRAVLYRGGSESISINLNGILRRGDMSQNLPLRPGDVITVPERAF